MDRRTPLFSLQSFGWLLALGALGLGSCSSRLNTTDVEATIKADIERQGRRLSLKSVLCPSDITRQTGAYFRCVGELNPEGTFTINVIQQDEGNISWDVPSSKALLNLPRVEDTIQQGLVQAFGKRALVDCGSATYRVNQPGDRFQCQVVGGIETGSSTIESVLVSIGSDGNLSWQELQPAAPMAALSAGVSPAPAGTAPAAKQPSVSATPVKTTTVSGPAGRPINRPYIPGDDD